MLSNKKHQAFIDEYFLNNFNQTEAYKRAYGIVNNNVAGASASRLLKNIDVRDEINRRFSIGNYISKDKYEPKKNKVSNVYLIQEDALGLCKIGIANNPMTRLSNLQVSCPQNITLVGFFETENAGMYEAELHARYHSKHYRGEWFRLLDSDIEELLNEWKSRPKIAKDLKKNISSPSRQPNLI